MGHIKKKHSQQPKIPSRNSSRALTAHLINQNHSHFFLQGALCCGTTPSNSLAEMRACISLNTFITHPTQILLLKMAPPWKHVLHLSLAQASIAQLRVPQGTGKSTPGERGGCLPRGAGSSPLLPALQGLCCRVCSCSAGRNGLPQEDGNALPGLERCPCESAGEIERSWEAAALCQPYWQPVLSGMRSKPS